MAPCCHPKSFQCWEAAELSLHRDRGEGARRKFQRAKPEHSWEQLPKMGVNGNEEFRIFCPGTKSSF